MKLPFDHFDSIARWYDRLISPPDDERLLELLDARPGDLALDIGGGTGLWARLLAGRGVRVIVCDASPGMVRQAVAKGIPAVLCDAMRLPFAAGAAERVLVVDAFHHFVTPSPQIAQPAAARELLRVLAGGGRLVVAEPDVTHFSAKLIVLMEKLLLMGSRFLTPQQLTGLFRECGASSMSQEFDGASVRVVVERSARGE